MTLPPTLEQRRRIEAILVTELADRTEVRLGDVCRSVSNTAIATKAYDLDYRITPRVISALLRKRGYYKSGTIGSGYDREPLYLLKP